MLEVFLVSHLVRGMGELAAERGLSVGRWKVYTAICWIVFEISGILISLYLFDELNVLGLLITYALPAMVCLALRWHLYKYPDVTLWTHEIVVDPIDLLLSIQD